MTDPASQQLLAWAATRDERAFRAVVERFAGLVHGVALRRTGNPALAAEAAQAVFVKLALMPREAAAHPAAWLHRVAVHESQHVLRSEFRHRRRAEAYAESLTAMNPGEPAPETWSAVRAHLDEALDHLTAADRRVLMLRYFDELTAPQIGQRMGISPEAAQKRAGRALERLSALLRRRGVAVPAVALAAGLSAQLTESAPAALVNRCAAAALGAAPASAASGFLTSSLAAMSAAKLTTAAVFALAAALPVAWDAAAASLRAPARFSQPSLTPPASPETSAARPAAVDAQPLTAFLQELDRLAQSGDDPPPGLELRLRRRVLEMDAAEISALAAALPQRPNPASLYSIVATIYSRWFETDPEGAKTAVTARTEPYLKHPARHGLLSTWAAADPQGALTWLTAHADLNDGGFALMSVFRGWAHTDPRAAADGALAVPEGDRLNAVHAALETWATTTQETENAVLWLNGVTDDALRHRASSTLVSTMSNWPMDAALHAALLFEDAEARTEAIEQPLRFTASNGAEDAARAGAAFSGLPPERQNPDIARRVLYGAVFGGGLDAGRAFIGRLAEGPAKSEAVTNMVAWAAQQGLFAEAAPDAARLPLEEGSTRMDLFTAQWAHRDFAAAQVWVRSLPEGPHRRKAEEGLALAAKK